MTIPFSNLPDAISHWASVKPDSPALKAPGAEDLSYAMLKQQLDTAAEQLSTLGFGADHRLALVLPQSILMASCLLTISATCAVYPIDDSLTVPELVKAFKKADVSAVLITPSGSIAARTAAAETGVPVIELVTPEGKPSGRYDLHGAPAAVSSSTIMQPDTIAFLISTSGTTGTSKLVPITNRMFAEVVAIKSEKIRVTPQDVILITNPLDLISALGSGLFLVIYCGGCATIDSAHDTQIFLDHIEHYQPNFIDVSSPLLHAIYNHLAQHPASAALKSMRFIRVSGAAFPAEMMRKIEEWTGVPIIHSYGMTEGLSGNLSNPMPPGIRKHETVGVVVHGEIGLFSQDGRQLPLTEIGELGIKSPHIFKGYFNPEDNVPSPFRDGWLMTGDIASVDSDGYVTIIGRRKEMINSGGLKILPNEVEEALTLHPDVADACVVPLPHPTLGEQAAVAVVRRSEALTGGDLVTYLQPRLAAYKIPTIIHFVDQIPRSSYGKLQRQQVVELLETISVPEGDRAVEILEGKVVSLWEEVLETTGITEHDSFLLSGGESITAVKLASRISETFGIHFAVLDVFDHPTAAEQVEAIKRRLPKTA